MVCKVEHVFRMMPFLQHISYTSYFCNVLAVIAQGDYLYVPPTITASQ